MNNTISVLICIFLQRFKNVADQEFSLEAAIKSIDKMSCELKKLNGNSEFIVKKKK